MASDTSAHNFDGTFDGKEESSDSSFHFTDNRKINPETGAPRAEDAEPLDDGLPNLSDEDLMKLHNDPDEDDNLMDELVQAKEQAQRNLDDLQRERASFVNFRKRAEKEKEAAVNLGVEMVLLSLLPVLDDIYRGREQGEFEGPVEAIMNKLEETLGKSGIERYGQVGDEFDPQIHEALMHRESPDVTVATIDMVMEPGYKLGDKVIRAARVGVQGPQA